MPITLKPQQSSPPTDVERGRSQETKVVNAAIAAKTQGGAAMPHATDAHESTSRVSSNSAARPGPMPKAPRPLGSMRTTSPDPMSNPGSPALHALEHLLGAGVIRQLSLQEPVPFSLASRDWEKVTAIDRSALGLNGGVFFASAGATGLLVIKEGGDQAQFLASRFLDHMGLEPPQADLIAASSDEGAAIRKALGEHVPEYAPTATRAQNFLLMDFVDGAALQQVGNPSIYREHIQKPAFLSRLGELVVYDLLMGNPDRIDLQENTTNLGNLMCTRGRGELKPIDSMFVPLAPEREGFAKLTIRKVIRGDEFPAHKVFLLLDKHLELPQDGKDACVQHIAAGMRKAATTLASDEFPNRWADYVRDMDGFGIAADAIPDALAMHKVAQEALKKV